MSFVSASIGLTLCFTNTQTHDCLFCFLSVFHINTNKKPTYGRAHTHTATPFLRNCFLNFTYWIFLTCLITDLSVSSLHCGSLSPTQSSSIPSSCRSLSLMSSSLRREGVPRSTDATIVQLSLESRHWSSLFINEDYTLYYRGISVTTLLFMFIHS